MAEQNVRFDIIARRFRAYSDRGQKRERESCES